MDERVKPPRLQTARLKSSHDSHGIIRPLAPAQRLQCIAQFDGERLVVRRGAQGDPPGVPGGRRRDDRVALNGHRHHKAVVIIRVLADKVDPPGRGGDPVRFAAINLGELPDGMFNGFLHEF